MSSFDYKHEDMQIGITKLNLTTNGTVQGSVLNIDDVEISRIKRLEIIIDSEMDELHIRVKKLALVNGEITEQTLNYHHNKRDKEDSIYYTTNGDTPRQFAPNGNN